MTEILNYVSSVLIKSTIKSSPLLNTIDFVYGSLSDGASIINLPIVNLGIASSISNSIGNVFNNIWLWLLYNLITPILLIVFVILFVAGQYYLIKAYIWIVKNIVLNVLRGYNSISKSAKVKQILNNYNKAVNLQ